MKAASTAAVDVDAGGGRAVLARVDERAGGRAAGRRLEVGVGVDDERRLAAELEVDALEVAGGQRLIRRPVSESPVSDTRSTSVWAARAAPTTSPRPVTTLRTPAGIPASSASSARRIVVSGVAVAGLRTIEFPAASAGPIFQIAIQIG